MDILRIIKHALLCLFLFTHENLVAQFSPGELSRAHESLEGTQNCTKCHEVGKEISGTKCLGCHTEIQHQLGRKKGFHFSSSSEPCVTCHKDHLGKDAKTIRFDEKTFEHSKTGFLLTGKHEKIRCEKCHRSNNIKDETVLALLQKYPHPTYLGLNTECISCHYDPHKGKFQTNCTSCHTTEGWSNVSSFNHTKTKFPLEGKHLQIDCNKCHTFLDKNKSEGQSDFRTAAFTDCAPCHSTPHKSKLNNKECKSCHHPEGWQYAMQKSFDHSMTSYSLVGRHSTLKCEQCHQGNSQKVFKEKFFLPFSHCTDCHTDKHNGEFLTSYNNNCSLCHTEHGFKPSTFTLTKHNESKFILTGAHAAVVCSNCHSRPPQNQLIFHFENVKCETCHEDKHKGQFASMMKDESCETCHSTVQWRTATFDHSATVFPLTGKHQQILCSQCHKETQQGNVVHFQKQSTDCQSCHNDVHEGQFAVHNATKCGRCHTSEGWKHLLFNHETHSSFSLQGGHKKVECRACHHEERAGNKIFIRFKPLSGRCESCHLKGTGQ